MTEKPTYEDLENRIRELERQFEESQRTIGTLRQSEYGYRNVLELTPDAIAINRMKDGLYMEVNRAFCRETGYSVEEIIGRTVLDVNIYADYADRERLLKPLREQGRVAGLEMRYRDRRGNINNYLVSARTFRYKGEDCLLVIATNINAIKKTQQTLEESEESYRNVLELAPDSVTISRIEDGCFLQVNARFCQLSGYTAEEVIGRSVIELGLIENPADRERLLETLQQQGQATGVEMKYRGKDGSPIDVLISARPIRFQGQDCLLAIGTDITHFKEAQRSLRESEEKYRTILESMEEVYYQMDLAGNLIFFNDALLKNFGRIPEELTGINYREFTSPEEAKKLLSIFSEVYLTGVSRPITEYEIIRIDGAVRTFQGSVSLLKNASGEPIGFQGIISDRTEQKKAEIAIRESEEKYRNILENIEEGYYEVDLAGNRTFFNQSLCRIYGYSPEEMSGMNYRTYMGSETSQKIYKIYNEVFRTGQPAHIIDYETIRKDGSKRMLETSVSLLKDPSGKPIGFRGLVRDRTEQKKSEKALRESEEKYRNILENMEEGYYEIDLAGSLTFFNRAFSRIIGYSPEEMEGLNYRKYVSSETAERIFKIFNEVYRTGRHAEIDDYEMIGKDGTVRIHEVSAFLMRNVLGEPIGFHGMIRDRTEQKKAETARRESEEKYRLLVENAHDGIYITQDGVVKFPNPRTEALTGYPAGALGGMSFLNLVHTDDREGFGEHEKKVSQENLPALHVFRLVNKDNETLWVELNSIPIVWEGRPAGLHFLRDITPQKKMEAQFLQAQKMEAIGTLAGGIAHDFNNLLMGIQGNASLSLLDIESGHPAHGRLKSIEQLVQTGAELTKQLLGTARGGKYEVKPTNLNNLLEVSSDLFGRTHKEIIIHKNLSKDLWTVEADRGQIEQVLLNLYVNAGHAMPGGGDLYLETKNVFLDDAYARPYGVAPGKYVRISITDTGIGMDESIRKRVFDPFFTTKEMGRGTGLGLASAYGIIKNHNGIINVYSERGEGTTFNIYLSITQKEIQEESDLQKEIFKGSESILFVDDEEGIVQIGKSLLENLGYRMITAGSGKEAIEIYLREGERIDLVILDMIMPGMNGGETYDQLKEINPSIKVLLCSGYSLNGQAKAILDRGCSGFIQKPFSFAEISKRVRQILDQ
jgi:two-component system, cell cycle sensor histidine kinase and response regulator CckA